jgi:hypothetical protein
MGDLQDTIANRAKEITGVALEVSGGQVTH